jgi:halocyanin-like protein
MGRSVDRRSFIGTVAVASAGLLAGCGGSGSGSESMPTGNAASAVAEYLSGTDNFDGNLQDETGSETVSVDVGSEGNGGNFGYAPAAISVDTGTTVTWVWTGLGSSHNVVHEDGDFESRQTAEEGFEYEFTFESSGTYLYYCTPHRSLGMKGAVVVE